MFLSLTKIPVFNSSRQICGTARIAARHRAKSRAAGGQVWHVPCANAALRPIRRRGKVVKVFDKEDESEECSSGCRLIFTYVIFNAPTSSLQLSQVQKTVPTL